MNPFCLLVWEQESTSMCHWPWIMPRFQRPLYFMSRALFMAVDLCTFTQQGLFSIVYAHVFHNMAAVLWTFFTPLGPFSIGFAHV